MNMKRSMLSVFPRIMGISIIGVVVMILGCSVEDSCDTTDVVVQNNPQHTSLEANKSQNSFFFEENFENCDVDKPAPNWDIVDHHMDWLVQTAPWDPAHKWYKGYGYGAITTVGDKDWQDYEIHCYMHTINNGKYDIALDVLCDFTLIDSKNYSYYML
jgi:hypothetical protein